MKAKISVTRKNNNSYVIKYDYKEFVYYPQLSFGYLEALQYLIDTFNLSLKIDINSGFIPSLHNVCSDLGIEYLEK